MKLPTNHAKVTLDKSLYFNSFFPLGFYQFDECSLGNGDHFGLYWPVGREDSEPIICETIHDEGSINPVYSRLDTFLIPAEAVDFDWFDALDPQNADVNSPHGLLERAKTKLRPETLQEAVAILETVTAVFPEFGSASCLLANGYKRLGRHDDALRAALHAIISPPCFGEVDDRVIHLFKSQEDAPEDIAENPLFIHRGNINWTFGGKKENDTYHILLDGMSYFEDAGHFISASVLAQAYAQRMCWETTAFQEHYNFDPRSFSERQIAISHQLPHGPRILNE